MCIIHKHICQNEQLPDNLPKRTIIAAASKVHCLQALTFLRLQYNLKRNKGANTIHLFSPLLVVDPQLN